MKDLIVAGLLTGSFVVSSPAAAALVDFEGLMDLNAVTTQYLSAGVTFSNVIALTAGASLNEFDFPPHSGQVVVWGTDSGPTEIVFTNPVNDVAAWFSYGSQLSMVAYDATGMNLGSFWSPGLSNLGASTRFSLPWQNIARLEIAGATAGTFTMDDLSFTPVPLPGAAWLFVSALAGIGLIGKGRS